MSELRRIARAAQESGDPENPTPEELREILTSVRSVAVVGLSRDPTKAARRVPSYLATKGFDVIPVNPNAERILGRESYGKLEEVEETVDLVLVFRPSEEAAQVVRRAAERPENPVIWLQEGITSPQEAARLRATGRRLVQDLCIFKVHRALD